MSCKIVQVVSQLPTSSLKLKRLEGFGDERVSGTKTPATLRSAIKFRVV
jgi:hypothetical protein